LHPTGAVGLDDRQIQGYMERVRDNREDIVGVGEVGLDYHHVEDPGKRERTREVFEDFVELSNELGLPLVVHTRNAMEDTLKILRSKKGKVLVHCFSGDLDDLEEVLDRGYNISLGGIIFRFRQKYEKIIDRVPLDNLLLETDAPFLAKNKSDTSYPWFIGEIAEEIADIKDVEFDEVWEAGGKNASDFYDLPIDIY
ncbi:MAG: TatD family hydrolase, partial [Candidatus Aenigmatarchaeota archaeon]